MANDGKFVDRFPHIRTAGRQNQLPDETAADCFTFPTSLAEAAEILSRNIARKNESSPTKATVISSHSHYRNYNTQIKEILEANVKKGFQNVRAELRETAYKSYWRDEVGKIPDQVPNLPIGMDPENTIFGHKPLVRTNASELLNPKKCRAQIEYEDKIGKDFYRISHNHSQPGEPKRRFGLPISQTGDKWAKRNRPISENSGRGVRTLLRWIDQSALATTSKSLAEFKKVHYYPLGKHRVLSGLPEGITDNSFFGRPTRHNMSPVLKGPDKLAPLLIAFLFRMKLIAKKIGLDLKHLKSEFASVDHENTGKLPADTVYSIVKKSGLNVDIEMMQYALTNLNYYNLEEKSISYTNLLDLLDVKNPVPSFGKYQSSDSEETEYKTVYNELCADLVKKNGDELKSEIPQPRIRLPSGPGWCLAHLDDLPGQTTVDDVLRPNVATLYGLTPYDFFKPRSEQFIRDLFIGKVGVEIPDDIFKIIWDEGIRRDGSMSVETFKNILNEISTGKLEQMADTTVGGKT